MSPAHKAFFILLAILLAGFVIVSPQGLLVAQEASATPTEIPFNELPECPPFTPDPLIPTPAPDPHDNSAPVCRLKTTLIVDVRELIEQGIDPRTVGISGDPVFSEESTPSPFATPAPSITFVEPVASPIAADVPHQTHALYLPSIQDDPTSELSASATPTSSLLISDSSEPSNTLYMPLLQGTLSSSAESADAELPVP